MFVGGEGVLVPTLIVGIEGENLTCLNPILTIDYLYKVVVPHSSHPFLMKYVVSTGRFD